MPNWTSFKYRDYYDVPRAVVLVLQDHRCILLDSKFDNALDEYEDVYTVYVLHHEADLSGSWVQLAGLASHILGHVPVADVRFDVSCRARLDLESPGLAQLLAGDPHRECARIGLVEDEEMEKNESLTKLP